MPLAAEYSGFDSKRDRIKHGRFEGAWYKLLADIYGKSRAEIEQREKKRHRRQRRTRVVATAVAIVTTIAGASLYLQARRERDRQTEVALAQGLAQQAQIRSDEDPEALTRGLLLATESMKRFKALGLYSLEADQAMRELLRLAARPVNPWARSTVVRDFEFSPHHASHLAYATEDGRVEVWDVSTRDKVMAVAAMGDIADISFSVDGRHLAAVGGTALKVYDATNGRELMSVHDGRGVEQVTFSTSGRYVAAASTDNSVTLYEVATGPDPIQWTVSLS